MKKLYIIIDLNTDTVFTGSYGQMGSPSFQPVRGFMNQSRMFDSYETAYNRIEEEVKHYSEEMAERYLVIREIIKT